MSWATLARSWVMMSESDIGVAVPVTVTLASPASIAISVTISPLADALTPMPSTEAPNDTLTISSSYMNRSSFMIMTSSPGCSAWSPSASLMAS